ncbi:MAG: response regulator [Crocinitomicaceae bacterium]|jgi:two-component system OmpR family response regulator|nr:response regulator [Crocinitomicaceae bacterium]MBK6950889.1 response regulator [Crocinitomicaceae bacterium]MBK9592073.1 response regulator [Crocinitomicaceae bacterium]
MIFLKRSAPAVQIAPERTGIIFIVEDNPMYAKALESSIRASFPEMAQVKTFPVGETCLLDLRRNPDVIIIDYFLDSKYDDAETGLEIIRQIRDEKPDVNIIVLSSQSEIDVVVEAVEKYNCSYVKKDEEAFYKVEMLIANMY